MFEINQDEKICNSIEVQIKVSVQKAYFVAAKEVGGF